MLVIFQNFNFAVNFQEPLRGAIAKWLLSQLFRFRLPAKDSCQFTAELTITVIKNNQNYKLERKI